MMRGEMVRGIQLRWFRMQVWHASCEEAYDSAPCLDQAALLQQLCHGDAALILAAFRYKVPCVKRQEIGNGQPERVSPVRIYEPCCALDLGHKPEEDIHVEEGQQVHKKERMPKAQLLPPSQGSKVSL